MGKDAKKAVVSDEWRNKNVEERLEFSLIKVWNTDSEIPCYKDILCVILNFIYIMYMYTQYSFNCVLNFCQQFLQNKSFIWIF